MLASESGDKLWLVTALRRWNEPMRADPSAAMALPSASDNRSDDDLRSIPLGDPPRDNLLQQQNNPLAASVTESVTSSALTTFVSTWFSTNSLIIKL